MAEETETIRVDKAKRGVEQRDINDWSGKRFVPPSGVTVPSEPQPFELFIHEYPAGVDKLIIFSNTANKWVTIGP